MKLWCAWLAIADTERPWRHLGVPLSSSDLEKLNAAATVDLSNGECTLFWYVKWLNRTSLADIVPDIVSAVPDQTKSKRTVAASLNNGRWLHYFKSQLSIDKFIQLLNLWEALQDVQLIPDQDDVWIWTLGSSGRFSS